MVDFFAASNGWVFPNVTIGCVGKHLIIFPLRPQYALMGRLNYDISNKQELEAFLGLEYNDCCFRVRLLARRWLDSNIANLVDDEKAQYDQGPFLEIHFKGLGGSGAKVKSILSEGILGYDKREKSLTK